MLEMEFHRVMPVLKVTDFETALRFYQEVLGFVVQWRFEDDGGQTAALELGETTIMLSTGEHLGVGKPVFTGTLYVDMTGVREFWERVNNRAPTVWPLEEMDYGTLEFGIRDPDGYVLAFSEPQPGER